MTENNGQKEMPGGCCGDDARKNCCEQMAKMMHSHCGNGDTGFDCAAMTQKMGCAPLKPAEDKQ